MYRAARILCAALLFCPIWTAHALDETAAVRVTPLLKSGTTWQGAPIVYPTGKAEVTALWVEIAPGGETGWHRHAVPSFAMLLEGTLEITTREGQIKRLQAGEALAEVVATGHNGRNVGSAPVKLVVFYAGAEGHALTTREP
jgi:quercetin dioxygenase-like cupin family protein